ncbi:uncharacterized protein ACNLHF_018554 [Anomaloglossus baeobatrachus]|uniref:uncharacterized protein LOC142309913 n=1 Tax=Anomaloglossus baeobatrachus TaxID=238106 RepID=UPI003F4FFD5C
MSSPLNDSNSQRCDSKSDSPPSYEEITGPAVWPVPHGPCYHHEWNYNSLPSAYHTYSNIPSLNVPLPASQHNSPATVDQWSTQTPRPMSSNHPVSQATVVYNQPSNTETPASTYNNISTPPNWADGIHTLNLATTTTQSVIAKRFQKGRPKVLGILMILAAIAQFGVGAVLPFNQSKSYSKSLSYGIPFWTSAIVIFTGSILLAATRRTSSLLVKTSIFFIILTWISCSVAIAFSYFDLEETKCYHGFCQSYSSATPLYYALIGVNALILLLSIVAALVGLCTLTSHSKQDPQESIVLPTVAPSAPPVDTAQRYL